MWNPNLQESQILKSLRFCMYAALNSFMLQHPYESAKIWLNTDARTIHISATLMQKERKDKPWSPIFLVVITCTNDDTSNRNLQLFQNKKATLQNIFSRCSVVIVLSQCHHGVVMVSSWCRHDYTHETYRVAISTKTWVECICTLYTLISNILIRILCHKKE